MMQYWHGIVMKGKHEAAAIGQNSSDVDRVGVSHTAPKTEAIDSAISEQMRRALASCSTGME